MSTFIAVPSGKRLVKRGSSSLQQVFHPAAYGLPQVHICACVAPGPGGRVANWLEQSFYIGEGGAAFSRRPGPFFGPYTQQELLIASMLQRVFVGLHASLAALLVWTLAAKGRVLEYDMVLTSELRAPDGF